ncbi:MAG: hypothetical protein KGL39_46285 [Patescibacteria group bacterium]|nr:hypothetical protein [Patescibacteria group bacterium]
MPKILKKFEHKAKVRAGSFASKYDWSLYLSGQNVQLSRGDDFPYATDEEEAQYVVDQKAEEPGIKDKDIRSLREVRKTNFITTLRAKGHEVNKKVNITELDDGDIVVTAVVMTEEEIAERAAASERRRAAAAAKGESTNGTASHESQTPVSGAVGAPE